MKNRLAFLTCLFCISVNSVVPVWGQELSIIEQDGKQIKVTAGVGRVMDNIMFNPIPEKFRIFETKYLNSDSNIRVSPSTDSEIVATLSFNTEIRVFEYNDEWDMIRYNGKIYYVYKDLVSDEKLNYQTYSTPYNHIKSYMDWEAIKSRSSAQWRLQQKAYTGEYGIRQVNGRFCVAVGSAYTTTVGQYLDLVLEDGTIITCILADCKADIHTNSDNTLTYDGSLAEFVVNTSSLSNTVRYTGDISTACDSWESTITEIRIYDIVEDY